LQVQTQTVTPSPSPLEAQEVDNDRLLRAERTMLIARWIGVVFAFVQVITFYRPYPRHILPIALVIVAIMATGNALFSYLLRRDPDAARLRRIAIATLAFDAASALALISTYTFDPETAIWAVMYIIPLGGAIRFQLRGAMLATIGIGIGYTLREILGSIHYHYEFLPTSITFRIGIALLIAYVSGSTTKELLAGRRRVDSANRELSELNRSMREFVSIASHDMRTPVSVISGLSNTIVRDGESMSDLQKRELIEVIYRRSKSLDRLVNDLLATSSIDAGIVPRRPERLDLQELLRDVTGHSDTWFVDLEVETGAMAYADPEHVRRIVGNLLSNAARFGEPPVSIIVRTTPPWVDVMIRDNGPGVPPSFIPRLFEKFARAPETARTIEGTGLGLSIVRGLVTENGGSVSYQKIDGAGAQFSVRLQQWSDAIDKRATT
jgi:signal transduction histidine kinase